MIRNCIFDVGGVLLDWNPERILTQMFDVERAKKLKEIMMDSPYWQELDRGSISIDEAVDIFSKEEPALREEITYALNHFIEYLPVIRENVEIAKKLKNEGFNLYILSNFQKEGFEKAQERYDFFNIFDGIVISSRIKMIKPDRDIFEYILEQYSLTPTECTFFDDSEKNVETAGDMGINAFHTPNHDAMKAACNKIMEKE